MKNSEFEEALAAKCGLTHKAAGEFLDAFWELLIATIKKGDQVDVLYGKFLCVKKAAREGRNPLTGAKIKIAAKVVPQFKAGKRFKDAVAGK